MLRVSQLPFPGEEPAQLRSIFDCSIVQKKRPPAGRAGEEKRREEVKKGRRGEGGRPAAEKHPSPEANQRQEKRDSQQSGSPCFSLLCFSLSHLHT
jgi:hypothetical protein